MVDKATKPKKPGIRIDVSETRLARVDLKSQAARKAAARRARGTGAPEDPMDPAKAYEDRLERRHRAEAAARSDAESREQREQQVRKAVDMEGREKREEMRRYFGGEVKEDTAPIERLVKAEAVAVVKAGRATRVTSSPLEVLISRKSLVRRQADAAQRFLDDWYDAGLSPIASVDHSRSGGGGSGFVAGGMPASERQAAARHRWRRAVVYLGHRFAPYVVAVVIEGELTGDRLEDIALKLVSRKNAAQRSAVLVDVLKIALDHLADFYRIPGRAADQRIAVKAWRDEEGEQATIRRDLWEKVDDALAGN